MNFEIDLPDVDEYLNIHELMRLRRIVGQSIIRFYEKSGSPAEGWSAQGMFIAEQVPVLDGGVYLIFVKYFCQKGNNGWGNSMITQLIAFTPDDIPDQVLDYMNDFKNENTIRLPDEVGG